MTQKSPSNFDPEDWGSVTLYKDEWWVIGKGNAFGPFGTYVSGPFNSRLKSEKEADTLVSLYGKLVTIRVVHSVFTS